MTRKARWKINLNHYIRQLPVGIFLLPILMTGCTTLAPSNKSITPLPSLQPAGQSRVYHNVMELNGRLSVHYQHDGKAEALHGSFTWKQTATGIDIALMSPLGQILATINVTPDNSTLMQSGQPPRNAANIDALTLATLGWPLPVSGLRDWLQGFAIDKNGRRFSATPESSSVTTPDGWHIHYSNWQEDVFPKRIDLERSTIQAGDVSLRIVVDDWLLPESSTATPSSR
jgi:outer membrane lipoprotein LolB